MAGDVGAIGGIISAVGGVVKGIAGGIVANKARKNLNKTLANAPKYNINKEVGDNQAMAKAQAFGRDRSVAMAGQDISQSAADASLQARDITSNTSSLLSTIAQINAQKNSQLRGLAGDEAAMQNQKLLNLQNVNNQVIDEKDKAWNYNVNMPFQNRVAQYRDQFKSAREVQMSS